MKVLIKNNTEINRYIDISTLEINKWYLFEDTYGYTLGYPLGGNNLYLIMLKHNENSTQELFPISKEGHCKFITAKEIKSITIEV